MVVGAVIADSLFFLGLPGKRGAVFKSGSVVASWAGGAGGSLMFFERKES